MPARPSSRDDALRRALAAWFERARRDLPWRRERSPYAVWLSEVMLQQTRVATVVPYFERFVARWPTLEALAAAPLDDVLAEWSGLGYYRRARALHAGVREVVARFGGRLPETPAELGEVPGIGPYTAGAIASLAFGRRAALVDGNVARVLARVFALDLDVGSSKGRKRVWELAERLVPERGAGAHNEALMELGATVCVPREPACGACPLATLCEARRAGRERELPVVAKKRAPPRVVAAAFVVERGERLLVGRRAATGLYAGLWEPPMLEIDAARGLDAALGREATGVALVGVREAGVVSHVLTHRRLEVRVAVARAARAGLPAARGAYDAFEWAPRELDARGVSTLARRVLACAANAEVAVRGGRHAS